MKTMASEPSLCGSNIEKPFLSVVMPVHHGERWLAQALDSISLQNSSGIECIILDSSDNDACERIVEGFRSRLGIRYERNVDVLSWPSKTNLGVERARAEHVAMLHQDDLWLPDRSKLVRQALEAFPDAVLFLNPSHIVDQNGRRLGTWRCPLAGRRALECREVAERLLIQNFVAIPAPVISRRAWLAAGGLDPDLWYTADWDLYLKLLRQGTAVYQPVPSTAFRVHGSSLTVSGSRHRAEFKEQMNIVLDRHIELAPARKRLQIRRRAAASIAINCELARAASGDASAIGRAIFEILLLGPRQAVRYLRDSRILERALPRVRARLAGTF